MSVPPKPKYACLTAILAIGVVVVVAACVSPEVRAALLGPQREEVRKGPPLVFPPIATLVSAESISFSDLARGDDVWRPLILDDARILLTAMSDNYRFFYPPHHRGCALWVSPDWYLRLTWADGTKMTLPLTADGDCILGLELTERGSASAEDSATYMVNGGPHDTLVTRCLGKGISKTPEKQPDPEAPK